MESTAAILKRWALEEGFDRAGISHLDPSDHSDAFREWIAAGEHAEMHWITRRESIRLHPGSMLDGACSALCVVLRYAPLEGEDPDEGELWGGVARYARGQDYHEVMWKRLDRLAERIESAYPGVKTRRYVDTGPVLERELAARAGLGAIGKNTLLIDPEIGSYFLIGEIFTTLELEADRPISDLCGSCSLCLDACPTGALVDAYRVDSRLCVSYWTIEHRGEFLPAMSAGGDEWVFGCDACQEVCPWNQVDEGADHEEFRLPRERGRLGLVDLLHLERERWVELFRGSPIKRAKLQGMQRNVAAVLGHRGGGDAELALIDALENPHAMVRVEVVRALKRIGSRETMAALEGRVEVESDEGVLSELRMALEVC